MGMPPPALPALRQERPEPSSISQSSHGALSASDSEADEEVRGAAMRH